MGSLSNLYISQSYQSLIHLGTNNTASATLIDLQDGLGNSIGVSVNTSGDLYLSGSLTASLQQGYAWVGNSNNRTTLVPTSSFGSALPAGTISSSAQITGLGFVSSSITASSLITASFSGNTLTFTKGNGTTFGIIIPDISGSTINTGSFVTTSSFNSYTASNDSKVNQLIAATASYAISSSVAAVDAVQQAQINSLIAFTGSNTNTSLNAYTASQNSFNASATASISQLLSFSSSLDVTYVTQNELASATGSLINQIDTKLNTSSFNAYTASNDSKVNSLINATASYANSASVATVDYNQQQQIDSLIAVTASFLTSSTDITSLNAFTASQETKNTTLASVTSSLNQFTSSANNRLNNLESTSASVNISIANINSTTASQATSISNLNTFSQSANTQLTNLSASQSIDNTKWDTLGGQTGSFITESETASFARTNIDNNFTANQTFTNITAVSASFTYVQTTYETSSVIYSSGSNQFGDELSDIQTLSGSVKIQGGLTINGVDITGSLNNLNSFTASALTNSASVNSSLINLNQFTSSQETKNSTLATYTASVDSSLANINTFTASNGNTSLNAYTSSNDSKVNALINATASYAISSSVAIVDAAQQLQINSLIAATSSYAISSSVSTLVSSSIQSLSASLTVTDEFLQAQIDALDPTGSATSIALLNAFTASQLIINTGYNTFTSSANQRLGSLETNSASVNTSISNINQFTQSAQSSINSLNSATSSYVTETESGSFLITASVNLNTLTFTKGDNTTFAVTVNTGSATDITSLNAFTASQLTINTGYNTFTQSIQTEVDSLQAATSSYAISSSVAAVDAAQQAQINSLINATSSYADSASFAASQLAQDNRIDGLSAQTSSYITESETASFARTNVDNNFSANQTFTNITAVSASFTYVQTTYETSSIIYSSGSNQFGDELSDIQTLSGSVRVQGSLTVNGTPVQTSSVDISSLNAFTASQETKDLTLASVTSSLNSATASLFTSASLALVTASASGNTITFTKGNSSTFSVSVDTGSATTTIYDTVYTGESITKGDPLYISGAQGANPIVYKADAAIAAKMPVTYVSNETIGAGTTTEAIILGHIEGINLTGYVAGQTIYVAEGGGWSASLPSGSNSVTQLLGVVTKGGSGGKGLVLNPGPAQLPGLDTGYLWVGGSTNQPVQVTSASFASSASFNSYTSSTDSRLTNIETTTASLNTSVAALNTFTQSQETKNSTLATYTASVDSQLSSLTNATASYAISSSVAAVDAGQQSQINSLIAATGSYITTPLTSLNSFTASQDTKNSTLATYTASVDSSLTNINNFTASNGNTSLNSYTQSNDTKWSNLAGQTGSYVTSAITASSLVTASVNLNTITFTKGDASTFNITVNTGSGTSTDLTSLNAFTASQDTKNTTLASVTSSLILSQSIDNTKWNNLGSQSGSFVTESETGSFVKVDVANIFTQPQRINYSDGTGSLFTTDRIQTELPSNKESGYVLKNQFGTTVVNMGQDNGGDSSGFIIVTSVSGGVSATISKNGFEGRVDTTQFTASLTEGYVFVGNASGKTSLVATSSFGGGGGSDLTSLNAFTASQYVSNSFFATTGSNTFRGDQTFQDAALNATTLVSTSGSLMLVAKSFTSASSHLSASTSTQVNLIFKNNSNTADTIISGSNNIFTNPTAPAAGLKRYIGGSNNIINTAGAPQISASMQYSPTFTSNYIVGIMNMRGPISSSTWNILSNIIVGTVSLGAAAPSTADKLVSGLTFSSNNIQGALTLIANQSNLASTTTIQSNNINGTANLTLSSSAATFSNNIVNDSGFSLINQYYSGSAGTGSITVSRNTIGGASNVITTIGIADAGASQPSIINSTIGGSGNNIHSNASGAGSRNSINATTVFGNTLIVSASSNSSTTNEYGSAFFGRHNAQNENRAKTSQTIFAVGTGTAAFKKTGFLIDSGSNTFVEGTFNVSGSSTFTGSLNGMLLTQGPGKNNTGLGTNVLQNSVSGGNVAIGDSALSANTSGTDNVAIGSSALQVNTSGDRNIAIGSNVLDSNTIGALNVGIGNATLAGLVDGVSNTGIGFEALKNQTTGSYNTGIGNQTLNQNISGSGNIAIGSSAGYNETSSNNFYLTNNNFSSINADRSGSLMWGKMDNTTANQTLQINAKTNVTNELLLTRGSNKQSDIVSVNGSATISNSLVTSNSIILVTTQNGVVGVDEYPAVVTNKGTGTFDIQHNYAGNLDVGYLIINN